MNRLLASYPARSAQKPRGRFKSYLTLVAGFISAVSGVRADIVVDSADTSGVSVTGSWTTASHPGSNGVSYRHDNNGGKGEKSIRFSPAITTPGNYHVFLWWVAGSNRAANVPVSITHAGGISQMSVNQKLYGSQWVSMGTYAFNAGTSGSILISNAGTTNYVIADAVRLVSADLFESIIDNTDSAAIKTGTWTAATSVPGYYGSNYVADGASGKGSKSVRYVPTVPSLGLYEIFARWTSASNRSKDVPYTVHAVDGAVTLLTDQTTGGGQWQSLGTYVLAPGASNDVHLTTEGTNGKYVIADAVRFSQSAAVDVIVDNADPTGIALTGEWITSSANPPLHQGPDYLTDGNSGKGSKSVRFTPNLPGGGSYEVFMKWSAGSNRPAKVPVSITSAAGITRLSVDQKVNGGSWNSLGTFGFMPGNRGSVLITTEGTSGSYVIADAVRFVRRAAEWTPNDLGDQVWLDWRAEDLPDGATSAWTDRQVGLTATQTNSAKQPVKQGSEVYFAPGTGQSLTIPHLDGSPWTPHVTHRAVGLLFRVDLAGGGDGTIFAINGYGGGWEAQPAIKYNRNTDKISVNWITVGGANMIEFPLSTTASQWHCLVARREGVHIYASLDGKDTNGNYGETALEMKDWAVPDSNVSNTGIIGDHRGYNPAIAIDSVLLMQGDLSRETAEKLTGWAMWRKSAQATLPASHPYRNQPPYASTPLTQFTESTPAEWTGTVNFWANMALSEIPYDGTPLDLTGWTLDFEDQFDQHTVTDDVQGKGNWFSPTHPEGTGTAYSVRPGVNATNRALGTPAASGYPATYIQSNSSMTIRMQNVNGWKSGIFCSVNSNGYGRTWRYPYVEARMKIGPSSTGSYRGAWPAFWLKSINYFSNRAETNLEYDVYEGYISDVKGHHAAIHHWPANRVRPGRLAAKRSTSNYRGLLAGTPHGAIDLFDGQYHTYGTMITPEWVINYFVGKEIHRFPTPIEMKQRLWILVDLAMKSGEQSGAHGVYELTIDYIRVYQNPAYDSE